MRNNKFFIDIIGKRGTGKSSLRDRLFTEGKDYANPPENESLVKGKQYFSVTKNKTITLLDMSWLPSFTLRSISIYCFDLTDSNAIDNARLTIERLHLERYIGRFILFLVGTKSDLPRASGNELERIQEFVSEYDYVAYVGETSAKTTENLNEIFEAMVSATIDLLDKKDAKGPGITLPPLKANMPKTRAIMNRERCA